MKMPNSIFLLIQTTCLCFKIAWIAKIRFSSQYHFNQWIWNSTEKTDQSSDQGCALALPSRLRGPALIFRQQQKRMQSPRWATNFLTRKTCTIFTQLHDLLFEIQLRDENSLTKCVSPFLISCVVLKFARQNGSIQNSSVKTSSQNSSVKSKH